MEEFADAYSVRLLAHTGRYLWADPDLKSVSQKKGKDTKGVIWRVELVPERGAIRLKSVHDLYLHASDYAFLFGATGKKVTQSYASKADSSLEWVPEKCTPYVKLKARSNKYLRANGGVPPYRNSVTHDLPLLQGNQHVVLWMVEVVRKKDAPSLQPSRLPTPRHSDATSSKSSSQHKQKEDSSDDEAPHFTPARSSTSRQKLKPTVEIPPSAEPSSSSEPSSPVPLRRTRPVRVDADSSPPPRWNPPAREADSPLPPRRRTPPARQDDSPPPRRRTSPARQDDSPPPRRRTSPARQDDSPPPRRRTPPARQADSRRRTSPARQDDSRRRTSPARQDDSPPPRRRTSPARQDDSPPPRRRTPPARQDDSPPPPRIRTPPAREDGDSPRPRSRTPRFREANNSPSPRMKILSTDDFDRPSPRIRPPTTLESSRSPPRRESSESSVPRSRFRPPDNDEENESSSRGRASFKTAEQKSANARRIIYEVAEDDGEVLAIEEGSFGDFMFEGSTVDELIEQLRRKTKIDDIILCMRNPKSTKLFKMRLALPSNKAPLSVVVVRQNSHFGRTLSIQSTR